MAAISVQLAPSNSTDVLFRTWGKAISDQMAAGGWVKTNDANQINWATVLAPTTGGGGGVSMGYEMWRSNDAGDGLQEMFVKIEFGTLGSSATYKDNPGYWITVGWSTDGAGVLGSAGKSERFPFGSAYAANASSTTPFWSNLSVGIGRLQIAMFTGDGANLGAVALRGSYISIERLRNSSFALTNNIFIFGVSPINSAGAMPFYNQTISPTLTYAASIYGAGTTATNVPRMANITYADAVSGGSAGYGLVFGQMGGFTAPSANTFGGVTGSFGSAQTNDIKITTFGTERNYIICATSPFFSPASGNQANIIMRFE